MIQEGYPIPFTKDGKIDVNKVKHDYKNSVFFILEAKKVLEKEPRSKEAKALLEKVSGRLDYLRRILEDHGEVV